MTPEQRRRLKELHKQQAEMEALLQATDDQIVAAWASAWTETAKELALLEEALYTEGVTVSRTVKSRQARKALKIINARLEGLLHQATVQASASARKAVAQAARDLAGSATFTLGGTVDISRASGQTINAIVKRSTQQITVLAYELADDATASMKRALLRGVSSGQGPKEIARRMLKDTETVFNGGRERAITIARTEALDAYRAATHEEYQANADLLDGWVWVSEPGACMVCLAMGGTMHKLDETGPLDHPRGRCSREPKFKPMKGFKDPTPLPTGEERLKAMPEDEQRRILGPARYEAWKNGTPLSAMVERGKNPGWRDSYKAVPLDKLPESNYKALAHEVRTRAAAAEPVTTELMKSLAKAHDAELAGLQFRLKTEESLTRKIETDTPPGGSPRRAAESISDSLRYTMVVADERYTAAAQATLKALAEMGYSIRVKNYWGSAENPYRGINVAITPMSGQKFELQFHTPSSLNAKEPTLHNLYEKRRIIKDLTSPKAVSLYNQMWEIVRSIPVPPGALEV